MPALRSALVVALLLVSTVASAQLQITTPDGKASAKIGILGQVQGEWIDTADGEHTSQNLYVRRIRLLLGGKLGEKFTFFMDTDSPNIGKANATGAKTEASMYVQDLILTYSPTPTWRVDTGMLLLPLAYQTGQGATTLLGIDYSQWAFVASAPTTSRVGRDYGVQLRGYPFKQHMEVRAGVFQGVRGNQSRNPFRTFGRVVYYPFEAQTDFFYTGTTLGKRKLLGVGASYDQQDDYSTFGADVFLDLPVRGGDAITAQVDVLRIDGGTLIPTLPRMDVMLLEAGYYFSKVKLEPFIQLSSRDFDNEASKDERYAQVGLAWWPEGHKLNLKLGFTRFETDDAPDRDQVLAQLQLFLF